ncbi:glycosyltransferase family A protein [Paraclostridium bifermentans]|uniref:glycosyltransferase family A protein n=1 Tax=Paraclostridium bifermentans TaxID=1490 RepID=UPI0018986CCF|nr:glycosyltransferase family A protein [Paraclostridium bifermentans]
MYKFSLVLATYGRLDEVRDFFDSIVNSDYNLSKVEIIVVDQNDSINLDQIIKSYNNKVNIKHIKSQVKGLSKNRNIGINISSGEYIAFPDDDCKYMKDTLKIVDEYFEKNKELYAIMGRIIDENGDDCIRKWSESEEIINKYNFYTKLSSITLFKRNTKPKQLFNERLGVGEYFGSNEDADIVYKSIKSNKKIKYFPSIVLFHPKPKNIIDRNKVNSYGLGFGALCKENFDFNISLLYVKVIVYHSLKMIISIVKFDKDGCNLRYEYLKSRFRGFYEYKKERFSDE